MIGERIKLLYGLDKRENVKALADKMGKSMSMVWKYPSYDYPPTALMDQIKKDFDGLEDRKAINWNWLFTGYGSMFMGEDFVPPQPPTPKNKLEELVIKMSEDIAFLKSKVITHDNFITGMQGALGKHKAYPEKVHTTNCKKLEVSDNQEDLAA
ncbi:hypothetical protein [Flammeovirga pacifica]|uniref:Uncharacterized protein n=1 Tax=Flammeovirga pacifica TaxID=915059 RepID=A0A1S1Z281_FLAPC|nr:hypothetical protein [Flammeovirga pacifica]OHX67351.1 hypothetical protein NH26_13870 [Flammeovirga pacifica]